MIIDGIRTVLDSKIDGYHKPSKFEVCGVTIFYQRGDEDLEEKWREILEEWLPEYDSVGWLEGLTSIHIAPDITPNGSYGYYQPMLKRGSIDIDHKITDDMVGMGPSNVTEILTHELIHHAHIHINGFDNNAKDVDDIFEKYIRTNVSYYAGESVAEAVAEIGAGIVHGDEYPDNIHTYYEKKDGPMGAYEI